MCIVIVAATNCSGLQIKSGGDLAMALQPILGNGATVLVSIGLFAAGLTSTITAPLATAYATSGILGIPQDMKTKKFQVIWLIVIASGMIFVAFNHSSPTQLILIAQGANAKMCIRDRYSWDTPYSQYESTGYVATERPWYKDALKANGEIVFTPPYMSYANHYILSTMSQLQPDGKTVFAYDIKMGDIQNIVTSLQNYDDEIMMIYDNNGTIIGSSRENYLGGNLKDSLEQSKVVLNDANQAVKDAKDLTQEQIQKLQEEADYAKAFYQFKEGFYDEYQGLLKTPQKSHLIQVDHTYYYSYLSVSYTHLKRKLLIQLPFHI